EICLTASATISATLTGTAPWNITWSDGVVQTGISTSTVDRTVSPSSSTTYTITAVSDASCTGSSSGAAVVTVTDCGDIQPPTAPSNLTATPGRRKIDLSWSESTDSFGVTEYRVWRSTSSTSGFAQIGTSTSISYRDSGIKGGPYYYYVTAVDAAGNISAESNTVSASPE
ncbi:MAG: hypothetical protein KY432_01320, partial [Acidobacteria bacterium]|nr:hypothetical protein [Acidobacteriota bacterium]